LISLLAGCGLLVEKLERFAIDGKALPLVNDALDEIPPAALQQGVCGARSAIDVAEAQVSGLLLQRYKELGADALPALGWPDQTCGSPGRQVTMGGDGLSLESGNTANAPFSKCHNSDRKAALIREGLKIALRVARAAGTVV
jgi:hypothetical protein